MTKSVPKQDRPRKKRQKVIAAGLFLLALLGTVLLVSALGGGCAAPVKGLWPPGPGEERFKIIVSIDRWHGLIGKWPQSDPTGRRMEDLTEWGYAERRYYLDGDVGPSGTLRALFLPSEGVVQVAQAGLTWSERTPQPPARMWTFYLTRRGYEKLLAHLATERKSTNVISRAGGARWYLSARSYHALHHCHHWTARALRAAGLPVWSSYALFKWSLERQLDRAQKFVEEDGTRKKPK